MNKFITAVLIFCGLALVAGAQDTSEPPVSIVNISGSASGFSSHGTHVASIGAFGLQVTKNVSVAYEQARVPDLNLTFKLGVVNYSTTADHLVGKKLASKFTFDLSNYVATFTAGAGKAYAPSGQSIAETAGFAITRPLAAHMGWQVISYQYIHSHFGSGVLDKGYQSASTGPIFYF